MSDIIPKMPDTKAVILNPGPKWWDVHLVDERWEWERYVSLPNTGDDGTWATSPKRAYLEDNTILLKTFSTRRDARAWCDEHGYPWDWR